MFIDTHAHYDYKKMSRIRTETLPKLSESGIKYVINPAITYESNFNMREKLSEYPFIYYAMGIHPKFAAKYTTDETDKLLNKISELIRLTPQTIAIGETGFDFHYFSPEESCEIQEYLFRKQIEIAEKFRLPLILHIRNADVQAISVLKEYSLNESGVVHCYNSDWETAKKYLEMGLYFGIGGSITYPENTMLREAVKNIPLSSIVLETDSPFVKPINYTESANTSLNIPVIAAETAKICGISVQKTEEITTANALRLFKNIKI